MASFEMVILRLVMGCLALWAPLLLVSYRLSFVPYLIICLIAIPIHRFKVDRSMISLISLFLLFVFWCGISVFWAFDPPYALKEFLKILPFFLGGISLVCYFQHVPRSQAQSLIYAFLVGVLITFCLLFVDNVVGFELTKWKKWEVGSSLTKTYSYAILALILSVNLGLSNIYSTQMKRWMRIVISLFSFCGLLIFSRQYDFDAGPVALMIMAFSYLIALLFPQGFPIFIRYGMVALFFASPLIIAQILTPPTWGFILEKEINPSHLQRLEILEWGANLIKEKPFQGYGFGQVRKLNEISRPRDYGNHWPDDILEERNLARILNQKAEHQIDLITHAPPRYWGANACHMHNGFMQIWVELGLIGVLIAATLFFMGLKKIETFQVSQHQRAHFYGFLMALMLVFSVSFGPWETWWLSSMVLLIFLYCLNLKVHECSIKDT
jgi:O-antigen ligase